MAGKTLLLILPEEEMMKSFQDKLSEKYELFLTADLKEGLALFEEQWDFIGAILVDLNAVRGNLTVIQDVGKPLIGIVSEVPNESDAEFLMYGFQDILSQLSPKELIIQRIENVLHAADSLSFHEIERMLCALPCTVFFKDAQGRYVFSTQKWTLKHNEHDPDWSIHGKTDLDIRDNKENARQAMESDQKIIESGKGMDYVIEEDSDEQQLFFELIKRPVKDDDGKVMGIIALVNNVTEREKLRRELEKRSRTDALTDLLNKHTAEERIQLVLADSPGSNEQCALLMIDVDNFKNVNDTYGHAMGDHVLSKIGHLLRLGSRGTDVVGRVGGDEFILLLRGIPNEEIACHTAERISRQVVEAFAGGELENLVTLSIGIANYPKDGETFEELYKAADSALYYVKKHGKGTYHVYE